MMRKYPRQEMVKALFGCTNDEYNRLVQLVGDGSLSYFVLPDCIQERTIQRQQANEQAGKQEEKATTSNNVKVGVMGPDDQSQPTRTASIETSPNAAGAASTDEQW